MYCGRCKRSIYSRQSSLCNPCAAAQTLGEELSQAWQDEKLRTIAGDIAVSAVRQVRALRLHKPNPAPEATSKAGASRPPLDRRPARRSRSPLREESRKGASRYPGKQAKEEPQRSLRARTPPRRSSRSEVEENPLAKPIPPDFSPSPYSYYSTSEDEEKNPQKQVVEGEEKRGREERSGAAGAPKGRSESGRATSQNKKEGSRSEGQTSYPAPKLATVDVGSEEDKRLSKAQYLQSLKEEQTPLRLEENPQSRKSERPRGNLLQVFDEKPERKDGEKKRRRKSKWQRK